MNNQDSNTAAATATGAQPALDKAKIFVGGLSWQTTEETLRYHFEQYGEVVSVEVMRDRDTGNPRGFAFVVFQEDATVDLVMNNLPHEINHKVVDVKRAQARGAAPPSIHKHHGQSSGGGGGPFHGHPEKDENSVAGSVGAGAVAAMSGNGTTTGHGGSTTGSGSGSGAGSFTNPNGSSTSTSTRDMTPEELQNKIFVGGLPVHVDNQSLKDFFMQFGNVIDAIVMMDVAQGRSRGFGFVTFEDGTGGAQKALAAQPLYIDHKYVEIKLAQPKGSQNAGGDNMVKKNVHQNAGLRNASFASSQSKGEFAGFAASYGRNGWKAGYGSYAFGKCGWAVEDWDTFLDLSEKSGFSFVNQHHRHHRPLSLPVKEEEVVDSSSRRRKRDSHDASNPVTSSSSSSSSNMNSNSNSNRNTHVPNNPHDGEIMSKSKRSRHR